MISSLVKVEKCLPDEKGDRVSICGTSSACGSNLLLRFSINDVDWKIPLSYCMILVRLIVIYGLLGLTTSFTVADLEQSLPSTLLKLSKNRNTKILDMVPFIKSSMFTTEYIFHTTSNKSMRFAGANPRSAFLMYILNDLMTINLT